ncbi:MAG: ribosome-binding factor A [Candidatus Methylacidiphilales bacterium]|nr:ribosome-binding factor A [Candidatus Methylacidiphilales bacterium]
MSTRRTIRVSEIVRKELAVLITKAIELEGVLVTISGIDTTTDLKQSTVYVSVLDAALDRDYVLSVLHKHRREWQSIIGRKMVTKATPALVFRFDEAMERGDRVIGIMHEIDRLVPATASAGETTAPTHVDDEETGH